MKTDFCLDSIILLSLMKWITKKLQATGPGLAVLSNFGTL